MAYANARNAASLYLRRAVTLEYDVIPSQIQMYSERMSNTKRNGTAEKHKSPSDAGLYDTLRCLAVVVLVGGDVRVELRPTIPLVTDPCIIMHSTYCSSFSLLSRSEVSSPLACACAI